MCGDEVSPDHVLRPDKAYSDLLLSPAMEVESVEVEVTAEGSAKEVTVALSVNTYHPLDCSCR